MDDFLDIMDSDTAVSSYDKPKQEEKPAYEKPAYNNNGGGYNKGNFNSNAPKKENLWDKKEFTPLKIDVANFKRTKKTFSIATHGREEMSVEDIDKIVKIAKVLFTTGYTFRYSADKRDMVGSAVAKLENAKLDVYLPFKAFNKEMNNPLKFAPTITAYGIAANNHKLFNPNPSRPDMVLAPAGRAVFANKVHLMLGDNCLDPLDIMIIHSKAGDEVLTKQTDYKALGDTSFFMRICNESNIRLYNVSKDESIKKFSEYLRSLENN